MSHKTDAGQVRGDSTDSEALWNSFSDDLRRFIARRNREGAPRRVVIAGTGPRAMPLWAEFTALLSSPRLPSGLK